MGVTDWMMIQNTKHISGICIIMSVSGGTIYHMCKYLYIYMYIYISYIYIVCII